MITRFSKEWGRVCIDGSKSAESELTNFVNMVVYDSIGPLKT